MSQALTQQRLRIQFAKQGALRYVGHLGLATTWERVLRRADLPLEYTRGFNPRPRLQFAAALPVGLTSEAELLEVWLTGRVPLEPASALIDRLDATSPAGLRTLGVTEVAIKAPALPPQVIGAEYAITPNDSDLSVDDLWAHAQALLAQARIERVLRGKTYDLRPLILELRQADDGLLIARLSTGERANARADELVAALGLDLGQVSAHRRRLFLSDG
jgi:radical SAM-linked protein